MMESSILVKVKNKEIKHINKVMEYNIFLIKVSIKVNTTKIKNMVKES